MIFFFLFNWDCWLAAVAQLKSDNALYGSSPIDKVSFFFNYYFICCDILFIFLCYNFEFTWFLFLSHVCGLLKVLFLFSIFVCAL